MSEDVVLVGWKDAKPSDEAFAKSAHGRHWAKRYVSGNLRGCLADPQSSFAEPTDPTGFSPCTEAQFASYCLYLRTGNRMHLRCAERA